MTIPDSPSEQVIIIAPSTDLANLTIAWPPTPYDGQVIRVLSTKNITTLGHTGGNTNRAVNTIMASGDMSFVYDSVGATFMCTGATISSNVVSLAFTVSTSGGAGNAVFFATDNGLVGGNALFVSIQSIQPLFDIGDPTTAFSKAVVSNGNKTITIPCRYDGNCAQWSTINSFSSRHTCLNI